MVVGKEKSGTARFEAPQRRGVRLSAEAKREGVRDRKGVPLEAGSFGTFLRSGAC